MAGELLIPGVQAATVARTGDVALVAGNDITIETAENTTTESRASHTKKSGLFGTGGVGFTIGTQTRENTAEITELTHTGSLVGSTEGRVDIVAGGDVAIAGSDVLSTAGIGITGENVTITAVENSLSVVEAQKFRQAGINVSLKGGVVDTAMAVYGATRRGNEVEDDRLKALYAAKAGQTLFSNGQAGLNNFGDTGQQISDLASTSKETQTTVTGSQIEGDNVALAAAQDLILQSAQESHAMDARDHASNGEIGFTFGSEAGIGVYVSASVARGQGKTPTTTTKGTAPGAGGRLQGVLVFASLEPFSGDPP